MTTAQQWREAAIELRRHADQFEQRASEIEALPSMCAVVSQSGPKGEPLACAYGKGHDGGHSWASLPTWTRCEHGQLAPHSMESGTDLGVNPTLDCPGPQAEPKVN